MRILKVKFLNLNSLKGWHEINFNAPPFTDSGLFAITGETGAGKTTILDAITVALYDKIARACDSREIMTYYENESHAEVEFECNQKIYRATWHIKNARNGKARKTRDLAEISNRSIIIAEKVKEIEKKIIEITGLDYKRFTRSVMLAQGDFAAFLRADKNERGALLERITGTDIYSQLSAMAFSKAKEERGKYEELSRKANENKPLKFNEKNILKQKLLESREILNNLDIQQKTLNEQINWLKIIEKYEKELLEHSETFQQIKIEESAFAPQVLKLEAHRKASTYQSHWEWLALTKNQLAEKTTQINELKINIPRVQKEYSKIEKELLENQSLLEKSRLAQKQEIPVINKVIQYDQTIDNKKDALEKDDIEAKQLRQDVQKYQKNYDNLQQVYKKQSIEFSELNQWIEVHSHDKILESELPIFKEKFNQLSDLKIEIDNISKELHSDEKNLSTFIELKEKNQSEFQKNQHQQSDLKAKLQISEVDIHNLLKNKTFDEMNEAINSLNSEFQILANLLDIATHYRRKSEGFDRIKKQLAEKIAILKNQQDNDKKCGQNLEIAIHELENLRKIHQQELLIQKYEADRKSLEKNHPCPLCGSTKHPYHTDYKVNIIESEANLKHQEKRVTAYRDELRQAGNHLKITETDIENLEKYTQEIAEEKLVLKTEFEEKNQIISQIFDILQLDSIKSFYNQKQNEFDSLKKLGQEILAKQKIYDNILKKYQEFTEISRSLNAEIEKCTLQIDNLKSKINTFKVKLQQLAKNRLEIEGFLNNKLSNYDEKLKGESKHLIQTLKRRLKIYQQKIEALTACQKSLTASEKELSGLEKLMQQKHELLEKWELKIAEQNEELARLKKQRVDLFGDKNPQKEQDKLSQEIDLKENSIKNCQEKFNHYREELASEKARLNSLQTDFEKLETDFTEKQSNFLSKIKKEGFDSINHFEQAILEDKTKNQIETAQKIFEKRLIEINKLIQNVSHSLSTEKTKVLTNDNIQTVENEIVKVKEGYDKLQKENHEIDFRLNQDITLQKEYKLISEQLEKQRKIYHRWEDLNDLIGSAKGDKFRIFAQGLTLAKLVQLANFHLQKLNSRYLIKKGEDKELELNIIDTYQADNIRSMKTLSGGESFLVSLALALGLSDLAGQNAKISSLFIDEGFGTLDNNTLDVAIATLENLQASGKTIGIISHVHALKERISTQIVVKKKSSGISELHII